MLCKCSTHHGLLEPQHAMHSYFANYIPFSFLEIAFREKSRVQHLQY